MRDRDLSLPIGSNKPNPREWVSLWSCPLKMESPLENTFPPKSCVHNIVITYLIKEKIIIKPL